MVKAARVQQTRTRDLVADVDRLVAAYDAQRSDRIARDRRITFARQEARRALRARDSAQRAGRAAEVAAGAAIRRLVAEGLPRSDMAVLFGLSRSAVKRLLRVAAEATGHGTASPSTELIDSYPRGAFGAHGEANETARGAMKEGNL